MTNRRISPIHIWLTLVLVAAAAFTASFVRMTGDIPEISLANVGRPNVLGVEDAATQSVLLTVSAADRTLINTALRAQADDTVLSVLQRAAGQDSLAVETGQFEFGALVQAVGDYRGGTDGNYWLYAVDGRDGTVAADRYPIQGGEIISFRFAKQ